MPEYGYDFQQRAAVELSQLPQDATALPQLVTDYSKLRDACRKINMRRSGAK